MTGPPLFGRETELRAADAAFERALGGRGTLLLVTGEAGIGKSRLLREFESMALHRGCSVAWGRAWEAGGAPAFWPWMQICRTLAVDWGHASDGAGGADARFQRFDGVTQSLASASRNSPLLLLFDDVHVADEASLQLLVFAAQNLVQHPVVLVAAARDEAVAGREVFTALAREAQCLSPRRLAAIEVAAWVGHETRARQVHALSDGLPLFVEELLEVNPTGQAHRLNAVLDAHLARLSDESEPLLQRAAVVGRSFRLDDVADTHEDRDRAAALLAEVVDVRILRRSEDGYSFAHVLLRDRLYAQLEPSLKEALHAKLGWSFLERGEPERALHHLLQSGSPEVQRRIAEVALLAARAEFSNLAFEATIAKCEAGLGAAASEARETLQLRLLLAKALLVSGAIKRGREEAASAYALARGRGDVAGMAEAALTFGSEVFTGKVAPELIHMLQDVQVADPPAEYRPRVKARLAAARVPPKSAREAGEVLALAQQAVDEARALGNPGVLLETLRHAASAQGYLVPAVRQLEISDELFEVARQLGRADLLVQIAGFVFASRLVAGAPEPSVALEVLEGAASRLGRHHAWRVAAARSVQAVLRANFEEADAHLSTVEGIGRQYDLHDARIAGHALRIGIAGARGEPASVDRAAARDALQRPDMAFFRPWYLATLGRTDEARAELLAGVSRPTGFPQLILAASACCSLEDPDLAAKVRTGLADYGGRNEFFFGPGGVFCAGPTSYWLAQLNRLLGDEREARKGYESALEVAETAGFVALVERIRGQLGASVARAPKVSEALPLSLRREGDLWVLESGAEVVGHLPDVKGMAYLDQLLQKPGSELHVLELIGREHPDGDAGPMLDKLAIGRYRARAEQLRAEIDEAEHWSDLGRGEKARRELEMLQRELARGVGLGNRSRKAASELERARVNVQRRLKSAVDRVARVSPEIAEHIRRSLKTGVTCSYRP